MEGGFLDHNPAWRTYRYAGKKKEKKIADEETTQKLIAALENESIKYETYFKLIIATGMRRGECCGLKWGDINYQEHAIHIQRNVVKVTGEEIIVKEPKTAAGDRYVYFSPEMGNLLKEYRTECDWQAEAYEKRTLTEDDYVFRRQGLQLPMTPNSFTWRMKLILKKNGLPEKLNVHSLRHTNASLLIANGTDVATVAGCWATASHPRRWTSIPMRSIRTRKQPAKYCRRGWRSNSRPIGHMYAPAMSM